MRHVITTLGSAIVTLAAIAVIVGLVKAIAWLAAL